MLYEKADEDSLPGIFLLELKIYSSCETTVKRQHSIISKSVCSANGNESFSQFELCSSQTSSSVQNQAMDDVHLADSLESSHLHNLPFSTLRTKFCRHRAFEKPIMPSEYKSQLRHSAIFHPLFLYIQRLPTRSTHVPALSITL